MRCYLLKKFKYVRSMLPRIMNICIPVCFVIFMNYGYSFSVMKSPDPIYYLNNESLWDIIPSHLTKNEWIIVSDRDNNAIMSSPGKQSEVVYEGRYLELFKVLDKKGRYVKICSAKSDQSLGWGAVENFLLLDHAVKTDNCVTHKALIVNRLDDIQKQHIDYINPLKAPYENAKTINEKINILQFASIYQYFPNKKKPSYILLGKNPNFAIHNRHYSPDKVLLGWVPAKRVLEWNTREAFQPHEERKHPIYFFNHKQDLYAYYQKHQREDLIPSCNDIPSCIKSKNGDYSILPVLPEYESKLDTTPWPVERFRYALLEKNNDPKQALHIGIPSATIHHDRIRQLLENVRAESANRDILFVIDATFSMEPYIRLAGQIVNNIIEKFNASKQINQEIGHLKFGVFVYRDYPTDIYVFEQIIHLTSNGTAIKKKINQIQIHDKGRCTDDPFDKTCYPEAVFQGIVQSIDKANWSTNARKMIIHVGDMGNHGNDKYTVNDIVDRLVQKDVSYHAIQIVEQNSSHAFKSAQKLFCKQSILIIRNTIEQWRQKIVDISAAKLLPKPSINFLINYFNQLKKEIDAIDGCKNNHCCNVLTQSRWSLHCIKAKAFQLYETTIEKQIDTIATEVSASRLFIDDILMGKIQMPEYEKSTTFKPQLMPGIIDKLIDKIGNELFIKGEASVIKRFPDLKRYFSLMNTAMRLSEKNRYKQKIIHQSGLYIAKDYINKKAEFFTKAYVMLRRPGKKYGNNPPQLKKMILFEKREFEDLLNPLRCFMKQHGCNITPSNIKEIWRVFLTGVLGDRNKSIHINMDESINDAYKRQHGISLRKDHPLLKISYSKIASGLQTIPKQEKDKLCKYLCDSASGLIKIANNDANYVKYFGTKYIWIDSTLLP